MMWWLYNKNYVEAVEVEQESNEAGANLEESPRTRKSEEGRFTNFTIPEIKNGYIGEL